MVDIKRTINSVISYTNIKEALAITLGIMAGRRLPAIVSKVTPDLRNQRLIQLGIGFGGSALANYASEKTTGAMSEILGYGGLATATIAAMPIADFADEKLGQVVGGVRIIREPTVKVQSQVSTGIGKRLPLRGKSVGR
jgi:hypothetical protein